MTAAVANEASDDVLVARVAARDRAAFAVLSDRHGERPYRIGWRMLGDADEAEDVAQETMLRLWTHAANWQPGGGGIGAWLARVATNLCLDRLRRRKFVSDDAIPQRIDPDPLADEVLAAEEARRLARNAIAALPDNQRAAIVLTYYEELPNLEAAAALGLNIKAFESLLHRARVALRAALAGQEGVAA